jgi:hypothetical protein
MTIKILEEKVTRLEEKVNMMHEIIDIQTKYIDSFNTVLKLLTADKKTVAPVPAPAPAPPVAPAPPAICPGLQRIIY